MTKPCRVKLLCNVAFRGSSENLFINGFGGEISANRLTLQEGSRSAGFIIARIEEDSASMTVVIPKLQKLQEMRLPWRLRGKHGRYNLRTD